MIKPITDFDGYFISSDGNVYSNVCSGPRHKTKYSEELHLIKPRMGKTGYFRVFMRNNITNKRVDKYIHRLVAEAFIPNLEHKLFVDHIDTDRSNNRVENLCWVTLKENNAKTIELRHLIRDSRGRFVGNFDYLMDSLLPSS